MRRFILAALALLLVPAIAFGGAVVTDGNDTLKIKTKLDPAKASKRKGDARPVAVTYDYLAGTNDGSRLPDLHSVSVYLGGAVFGFDAFKKCEEKALVENGPKACPKGSKVGSGTATAEVHPADSTDKVDVNVDVTIFNAKNQTDPEGEDLDAPKDGILMYTEVAGAKIAIPFWAEDGATRITFYNSETPPDPNASDYEIKKVHLSMPRRTRQKGKHKVPFVAAPRKCNGSWIATTTNDRYDGGELTAKHEVKCKKAG